MQLLALVLFLLATSKNTDFKQLKPILEEFGGEDTAKVLKTAEELSGVISAVHGLNSHPQPTEKTEVKEEDKGINGGYPLAPISAVADDKITYALSRYVALGQ